MKNAPKVKGMWHGSVEHYVSEETEGDEMCHARVYRGKAYVLDEE